MKARTLAGSSVVGARPCDAPSGQIGRGPIAERDAGFLVAVGHRRIGHAHERMERARRHAGHELRQVMDGCRRCAEPRHFAGEERPIVAFTLALAQELTPIVARDLGRRFGNGNEPVPLMVDLAIGFQAFVACAHAMQRDQNHRQVIGEKEGELGAPLSRPCDRPLESALASRSSDAKRWRAPTPLS